MKSLLGGLHLVKALKPKTEVKTTPVSKKRTLFFGSDDDDGAVSKTATPAPPPPPPARPPSPPPEVVTRPRRVSSSPPLSSVPWCENPMFEPVSLEYVLVQPVQVRQNVLDWVKSRLDHTQATTKALVLCGPSGCGKRTLVRTVALALDIDCVEPDVCSFEDVFEALKEKAATSRFQLGEDDDKPRRPRVFLFTGVDGFLSASADTSDNYSYSTLTRLLDYLARTGEGMPPVVFTVHGYAGKAGWALRSSDTLYRLNCRRLNPTDKRDHTALSSLHSLLQQMCKVARAPDRSDEIMRSFDGDIKQAILRLELSVRSRCCVRPDGATTKDVEVSDPFEGARKVLDPGLRISYDTLVSIFDKVQNLTNVLWSNYLTGLDVKTSSASAESWSVYDVMRRRHSDMSSGLLLTGLRAHRVTNINFAGALNYDHLNPTYDTNKEMIREFRCGSSSTSKKFLCKGSPDVFRLSSLEAYERLSVMKSVGRITDDVSEVFMRSAEVLPSVPFIPWPEEQPQTYPPPRPHPPRKPLFAIHIDMSTFLDL